MEFYQPDNEHNDYNYRRGPSILKIISFIFMFLFAPSILIGMLVFFIFMRTLKWKPRVTILPITLAVLILIMFNPIESGSLISIDMIRNDSSTLISNYLYLSVILGLIAGYGIILYKAYELRRYPENVYIRGWSYEFEYAPTPLDLWRRKRNIKSLQEGNEFDYEKAPIGVIDEPVKNGDLEGTVDNKNSDRASITYRYYTEAMAHTLITGKTGSGKALHVDTEIRCKDKGWVTVGDIEIGDIIYDESGNHTEVKAIYQPMTEDHYELTFDNGEIVKACGDHLWNIGNVHNKNTVNTRELLENYSYDTEYTIEHKIDDIPITHKILKIKKIIDEPEDYLCFTVDSESHLFLITRSYIPTHNTVTMLSLIQNDILAGNPVCVIDFKKSPDLIYFLSKWAEESGREFYHFLSGKPGTYKNPYKSEQSTYDPLSTGNATAKADMILNLRSWDSSSEVFKKRTQDVLVSLFFLLDRTPRHLVPGIEWDNGGLAQFVSALDLNNFKRMIELMAIDMEKNRLSAGDIRRYNTLIELYKELSSKTRSALKEQIVELLSIARTLIVSNYGDWLAKGTSGSHIELMSIATDTDAPIVLFSFNQQEEPEFAEYIGSIVMSDISRVSALKNAKGDTTPFGVYIDEFQTLDPATVKDNLEKARSSKMYITLSLQSIDQIVSSAGSAGEAMANAILDTCSNFIFHDGSGYDTAEKMSKIIGKTRRYIYKTTSRPNDRFFKYRLMSIDKAIVSKDIEEDWLVPPSEFQSLESPSSSNGFKATAYIINKSSDDERFKRSGGALARKIHVVVAKETSDGVPDDFKREIFVDQINPEFKDLQTTAMLEYIEETLEDEGDWEIEDMEDTKDPSQPEETEQSQESEASEQSKEVDILGQNTKSQLDIFEQLRSRKVPAKKEGEEDGIEDTKKFNLPKL